MLSYRCIRGLFPTPQSFLVELPWHLSMLESRPEGPLLNSSQGISRCDCLENRDIPVNSAVNHYYYPLDNQSQIHLGYGFIHINPKQGWVNSSTTMVSSWVLSTRLDAGRSGRGMSKMTDDKCPTNIKHGMIGMMIIMGNSPN